MQSPVLALSAGAAASEPFLVEDVNLVRHFAPGLTLTVVEPADTKLLTITDTVTGLTRQYFNESGNICGEADVRAF